MTYHICCTKCERQVVVKYIVKFTSTLGIKKHMIPSECWVARRCVMEKRHAKPVPCDSNRSPSRITRDDVEQSPTRGIY